MAGMTVVVNERAQLAAMAVLRWRLFVNSLRSKGGQLELGARVLAACIYLVGGAGAALALGFSSYHFVSTNESELLAVLLWPVFLSWQLVPVLISSFSDNIELSGLLRFPLTYRGYVLVRLLHGLLDLGSILGTFCLLGILTGIAAARFSLLLPGILILATFALVNVLMSRMVFAWIERWLARRRSRELMGGVFIAGLLSIQLINPILQHYNDRTDTRARQIVGRLAPYQRALPPGVAAAAIDRVATRNYAAALRNVAYLLLYGAGIGALLSTRLRAEYRGENLSEAGSATDAGKPRRLARASPRVEARQVPVISTAIRPAPGRSVAAPVLAIIEKEFLYLRRSGPLLITLLTPVFMLVVLGSQWRGGTAYRFPAGMAYTTLVMANLIYNCFGTDGSGVQLYLTAPVPMRTVVLAKNLMSVCILLAQMALIFTAVSLIYRRPSLQIFVVTVTWILFGMPINLAMGNLLSLKSPRKMNFERFGRQQSSTLSALTSLGVQIAVIAIGGAVLFLVDRYAHHASLWAAVPVFTVMAAATFSIYFIVLDRVEEIASEQREILVMELSKS